MVLRIVALGSLLALQAPVAKPADVYLETLGASINPSGAVMIHRELIGPLLPEVAAGYDIKVMFTRPVPGNTVLCRVTRDGAICTTLDKALPVH